MARLLALLALVALALGCTAPPKDPAAPPTPSTRKPPITDDARTEDARATTFRIRSTSNCEGIGSASGFLVSAQQLVTNRHVVSGTTDVSLESWDGEPVGATIHGQGAWADLALLNVETSGVRTLPLAHTDPKIGTSIHVFGYPGGRQLTVTSGAVVGYTSDVELGTLGRVMKVDAAIEPGNSGGPVVDDTDTVVGVVYATKRSDGVGLAIPVSTLRDVMSDKRAVRPVEPCTGFFSP